MTIFWPLQVIPKPFPPRFLSNGSFHGIEPTSGGGWSFHIGKVGEFQIYLIPPHYASALALINAKIVWLQVFRTKKFGTTKKSERDTLERIKDSMARSLIFAVDVRRIFLADIAHEFYNNKRGFDKPFTPEDVVFRSPAMDSWLHVEYTTGAHAPPGYYEISKRSETLRDPLSITLNGMPLFLVIGAY